MVMKGKSYKKEQCPFRLNSKARPEYFNHSCNLEKGHKGKHECSCGQQFYSKTEMNINN